MSLLKHIPNTITSMNLLFGVLGVILTLEGRIEAAFFAMVAAAVCDFCDGFAARALNAFSQTGKELDSLADVVSFGVLPSMMLYKTMEAAAGPEFLKYIPLLLAVFSALRLAKFNTDERQHDSFLGLATPASAIICGSLVCLITRKPESFLASWAAQGWLIPTVAAALSALLVSEIPMFSMKFVKGKKQDKATVYKRIAFLIIMGLLLLAVLLFGLDWSAAILLSFIAYIGMNVAFVFMPIREA